MNKITIEQIESKIVDQSFIFSGTTTIAVIELENGFKVIGTSACVDPANYDESVGKTIARANAVEKIWAFEGYLLAEKLYQA